MRLSDNVKLPALQTICLATYGLPKSSKRDLNYVTLALSLKSDRISPTWSEKRANIDVNKQNKLGYKTR